MRKNPPRRVVTAKLRIADTSRRDEAMLLVCGGLVLALLTLASRIVTAL